MLELAVLLLERLRLELHPFVDPVLLVLQLQLAEAQGVVEAAVLSLPLPDVVLLQQLHLLLADLQQLVEEGYF